MPRPILKARSSYSPLTTPTRSTDSAKKKERRRVTLRRHGAACRRVTFSPFTKLRGGTPTKAKPPLLPDAETKNGLVTSGFTFSSVTEAEKRNQSRRKQELEVMRRLYSAVMRKPNSVKSLLLANVPGLKKLNTWATDWLEYAKAVRNAIPWPRRSRPKRRPRMLHRDPWTELDDADHRYVQQLALNSATSHPTVLVSAPKACPDNPLALASRTPTPDLTPAHIGGFTNLLRRAGIPVDEDEWQRKRVIYEDLRGVTHLQKRQRTFR